MWNPVDVWLMAELVLGGGGGTEVGPFDWYTAGYVC